MNTGVVESSQEGARQPGSEPEVRPIDTNIRYIGADIQDMEFVRCLNCVDNRQGFCLVQPVDTEDEQIPIVLVGALDDELDVYPRISERIQQDRRGGRSA